MTMLEQINLSAALPEVLLLTAICVFVLVEAILGKTRQLALDKFALLVIAVPAVTTLFQLGDAPVTAFNGMYVADAFSHLLKLFVYIAIAATVIYARRLRP